MGSYERSKKTGIQAVESSVDSFRTQRYPRTVDYVSAALNVDSEPVVWDALKPQLWRDALWYS